MQGNPIPVSRFMSCKCTNKTTLSIFDSQALEDQIAEASHLMMNMDAQHVSWRSSLERAQGNLSTSVGDALIAAACSTYHGPMEESVRDKLAADWMKACQSGLFDFEGKTVSKSEPNMIPIRSDFTVEGNLVFFEDVH